MRTMARKAKGHEGGSGMPHLPIETGIEQRKHCHGRRPAEAEGHRPGKHRFQTCLVSTGTHDNVSKEATVWQQQQ